MITITVPYDVSKLSLNQHLHWRSRKSRNDAAKNAARLAWIRAGRPKAEGRVRVSLIVRRGRRLDSDNALSGAKAALDALFCGRRYDGEAITPDDSPDWVELTIPQQEIGSHWKGREELIVIVEPAPNHNASTAPHNGQQAPSRVGCGQAASKGAAGAEAPLEPAWRWSREGHLPTLWVGSFTCGDFTASARIRTNTNPSAKLWCSFALHEGTRLVTTDAQGTSSVIGGRSWVERRVSAILQEHAATTTQEPIVSLSTPAREGNTPTPRSPRIASTQGGKDER